MTDVQLKEQNRVLKAQVKELLKERAACVKLCAKINAKLDRIEPLLKFQVMMAGRQSGRQAEAEKIVKAMIRRSNRKFPFPGKSRRIRRSRASQ